MAAVAPQPPAAAVAAARPKPKLRAERRPHVAGGLVWIVVIGAMLAGVVFMNVAVLRLNIALDKQGRERTRLRADVASLASQASSAQAAARIQAQARRELGVVPAPSEETQFVTLPVG